MQGLAWLRPGAQVSLVKALGTVIRRNQHKGQVKYKTLCPEAVLRSGVSQLTTSKPKVSVDECFDNDSHDDAYVR